uniref:Uncharacterized protein n=1 Tax=viral metagenome TaxID=1070528 RepID=A0A6C0KTW4_9ZZZZ
MDCECYKEIGRLQIKLNMEKLKCKIYKQILEKQLNVQLEDGVEDMINEIVSRFSTPQNIKHQTKVTVVQPEQYREVVPLKKKDTSVDITLSDEVNAIFGEFEKDKLETIISELFEALKDSRNYNHILTDIRINRSFYQCMLSPNAYFEMLQEHLTKIKDIFSKKNFTDKKIISTVYPKFFSSLEYRLLLLDGYHKQVLEVDDISKFKLCQKLGIKHNQTYIAFDKSDLVQYLLNYTLSFSSLSELIRNFINNPYNCSNIIYLKTSGDEGYAFYTLLKTEKNKRFWKMDCRLENLTIDLAEYITEYCINLFRTFYKAAMDTNVYIPEYQTRCCITEYECEELFQNIIIATDFFKLNSVLRNEVKNYCLFTSDSNDKFDLKNEDKEQVENFKKYKLTDEIIHETLNRMFDSLDDEHIRFLSMKFR